ncbi:MAG: hypothetical protein ACK4UO_16560 [Pseudolabrys sp.]
MNDEQLDRLLKDALQREPTREDDAAAARVLRRLAGPLPRQKQPFWRLPGVLLDWEFTPAWPRMAALACCAVMGFMVGLAGLDRAYEPVSRDYGSIFEVEPFNGAQQ